MASDVTGSVLRGLGVPYPLTPHHLWSAKASYTQQTPTAGEALPQGAYSLSLQSTGTQSAAKELRVKVQRGGSPGPEGAGMIYGYEGEAYRGSDYFTASNWQVIRTTVASDTGGLKDPDACRFYDTDRIDKIAVVYQRQAIGAGTTYIVECAVFDPSAGTWSTATVHTDTTLPANGYHPAIAYNRVDGHLYCFFWREDTTAERAQITTMRSLDGANWSTVSSGALRTTVNINTTVGAGASGWALGRLRAAFNGGQLLLVGAVESNNISLGVRSGFVQFSSINRGGSFQTVVITSVIGGGTAYRFGSHSVKTHRGTLHVSFVDTAVLNVISLPSASSRIDNRIDNFIVGSETLLFFETGAGATAVLQPGTGATITESEGSMWVTPDGRFLHAARSLATTATKPGNVFVVQSTDEAASWKYTGNGDDTAGYTDDSTVSYFADNATTMTSIVGLSYQGRQALIHITDSDVTTSTTLAVLWLGGGSTVNTPAMVARPSTYQYAPWSQSYLPFELPANIASLTTTGAGTDTITTAGLLNRVTSANTKFSTFAPTSTPTQGLIVRYALTINSGGAVGSEAIALKVRAADGSEDYEATIRFSALGFRMYDDNAAAPIGSDQSHTGSVEVLVAISSNKFSCWYRAISSKHDRFWTEAISNHSLTDGGGSTTIVTFGSLATSSANYDVHEIHIAAGAHTGSSQLGAGFTTPDDLSPLPIPRRGAFVGVDDGVMITAIDGSAMEGDTFNIDTAYEHPIERIFHRDSPSPRTQWRSDSVTSGNVAEQFIPFVLNKDASTPGAEEQGFGSTLCYATLAGVNWKDATIERWDVGTTAWVVVATISNEITTTFSLTRRGSELIIPSGVSGATGRFFYENECKGWSVKYGSVYRTITGNTAGTLAHQNSGTRPVFFLDGIDGTEPTLGTISLIPDRVSVTFHTNGEIGGGWGIRIAAQQTAPYTVAGVSKYETRLGHVSMGRTFVFGTQYGHGRVVMWESGDLTEDTPGGVRRAVRAGPGGRRQRLAWPDPIDTSQTQGTATNPDYIKSTTTAGNLPVAAQKDLPFSLLGLLESQGARDPITYFPSIPVSTGSTDTVHYLKRADHMLATISSAGQVESVVGDELDSSTGEAVRFSTIVLEEVR